MIDIEKNIAAVRARIRQAVQASAQNDCPVRGLDKKTEQQPVLLNNEAVTLVAVSKKQPVGAIEAAMAAGVVHFGENYVQEAIEKMDELSNKPAIWHFIGSIQSNKTAVLAERFDWVHSVDRLKIARRLNDQRPTTMPALNICLQVNIDGETSKSGLAAAELDELIPQIMQLPNLQLRGLMALPTADASATARQQSFWRMRQLFDHAQLKAGDSRFDSLSMGMSADFELAIEAGANVIRIGSDIFGPRRS